MNKAKIHHYSSQLQRVHYGYFLAACGVSVVVSVVALRNNNITALHLRDDVLAADQQNKDVESSLYTLRRYIYGHMNTNLETPNGVYPPIQLKYRYERLVQNEKNRVEAINSQVYTDAQHTCEQLYPHSLSGGPRVPCIQDYVTKHGAKEQPIEDSFYKFAFSSPFWSPDTAGISIIISGLLFIVFIVRFVIEMWFRHILRQHQ
ncbi:MAG: hypothetical protein NVSMB46_05020 [Candidatus Saccharimonadales bacterium]